MFQSKAICRGSFVLILECAAIWKKLKFLRDSQIPVIFQSNDAYFLALSPYFDLQEKHLPGLFASLSELHRFRAQPES